MQLKKITFVFALSAGISQAATLPNLGGLLGGGSGLGGTLGGIGNVGGIDIGAISGILGGNSGGLEDLVFNAAYMYASSDPRYSLALKALGINSAADLKKFLKGEGDGSNFQDVFTHLVAQYAQNNPQFQQWFAQNGVTDEISLETFMKGRGKKYQSTYNKMALSAARSNPNYQEWLTQLGISDVSDIQDLLNGSGGLGGQDLMATLKNLAAQYILSNPQYAQYIPLLKLIGIDLGDIGTPTDGGEIVIDDPTDPPDLGAFSGLSVKEIKSIRAAQTPKKKPIKK